MRFDSNLTDDAQLAELGRRVAQTRIELDLTQAQLAEQAGVSRSTVTSLERGGSITLVGLVRLLRALGLTANLDALVPEPAPSPLARTAREERRRQRASGRASRHDRGRRPPRWGDET